MPATRLEHDALGQVRVPRQAYYGAQTVRALANFPISGVTLQPEIVHAIAWVKRAAAEANARLGLLPRRAASAIRRACDEILADQWSDQFRVDIYQAGAGTSFHMNVNEVIANRANELLGGRRGQYRPLHPNDHVNMAQSTNDVVPTAVRLAVLMQLPALLQSMEQLERDFLRQARRCHPIVKSARTHLQDAVPIRLGQNFQAWALMVRHARAQVRVAARGLTALNLGGTAVGTGVNAHPRYQRLVVRLLRQWTKLPVQPARDLVHATQDLGDLARFSSSLRDYALSLIKIANDLRLMSSGPLTGLAEITLPAVQPGSSIMPGKVNPVMAEMLTMVSFQVIANDLALALAVQAGQLELNVMLPAAAYHLVHSVTIVTNASRVVAVRCIRGIQPNVARCRRYAESSASLVTALVPLIGYEQAAQVAQRAIREGQTIRDVVVAQGLLSAAQARRLLDPRRWTKPMRLRLP